MDKSIKEIETNLSNRFDSLTDEVKDLSAKISEAKLELGGEEVMDSASAPSGTVSTQWSNLSITVSSVLSEEREKEKWKLNLILHNVLEFSDTNSDVRKQHDTDAAKA